MLKNMKHRNETKHGLSYKHGTLDFATSFKLIPQTTLHTLVQKKLSFKIIL